MDKNDEKLNEAREFYLNQENAILDEAEAKLVERYKKYGLASSVPNNIAYTIISLIGTVMQDIANEYFAKGFNKKNMDKNFFKRYYPSVDTQERLNDRYKNNPLLMHDKIAEWDNMFNSTPESKFRE